MELKSILQLIKAAQETDYDIFEIEDKDFKLYLERGKEPVYTAAPANPAPVLAAPPAAAAAPPASAVEAPSAETAAGHSVAGANDILSPLVGVYHNAAKEVKIGDKLKSGDIVCQIEAMKLMNEITMPEDGEIVWVAAKEGDTVEYDQVLFSYLKG